MCLQALWDHKQSISKWNNQTDAGDDDNSINLIVEELLNMKSKIVKDELESAVKVLSQEIKWLQIEIRI